MEQNAIEKYKGGHSDEFMALLSPMKDQIYGRAMQLTRNHVDAEDLVQETFMKAFRFFCKFEKGSNFPAWLNRILTNNYITSYNKKKLDYLQVDFDRVQAVTKDTFIEMPSEEISRDSQNEWQKDYSDQFDDKVSAALAKLPETYRRVVLLAEIENLKYHEIASILNCPEGTVMSRLYRGRKILARLLKHYACRNGYYQRIH